MNSKFKIVAIVGARMNSSRLPGKHLLDLAGKPLIERLFERLSQVKLLDRIVLATTSDEYNKPLINWATNSNSSFLAYKYDVNDLMGRIEAVVQKEEADFIVYICGDCPLVEPQFIDHILNELISSHDKDYDTVTLREGVQTIHEGILIYRRKGWQKLLDISQSSQTREHVGYADKLVPTLRKLPISDCDDFSQTQHRISVDTPADYKFMSEIYSRWYENNALDSIVDLSWVIQQLEEDSHLKAINKHVKQKQPEIKYKTISLFCHVSKQIGMGHLKRCSEIAKALQEYFGIGSIIYIHGESKDIPWLITRTKWYSKEDDFLLAMEQNPHPLWILDFNPEFIKINNLQIICQKTKKNNNTKLIALDKLNQLLEYIDILFIPSFSSSVNNPKISIGWENYLFRPIKSTTNKQNVLVLTGGSDALGYGQYLPNILESCIPSDFHIHWVIGPYAPRPELPNTSRWHIHNNPQDLSKIISNSKIIISCYGLSLFESIASGALTLLLPPKYLCEKNELDALEEEQCCIIVRNEDEIETSVRSLFTNSLHQQKIASNANNLAKRINGLKKLMDIVKILLEK